MPVYDLAPFSSQRTPVKASSEPPAIAMKAKPQPVTDPGPAERSSTSPTTSEAHHRMHRQCRTTLTLTGCRDNPASKRGRIARDENRIQRRNNQHKGKRKGAGSFCLQWPTPASGRIAITLKANGN